MKKMKLLAIGLTAAAMLAACGKQAETAEETVAVATEEATSEAASTEETTTTEETTSEEVSTQEDDVDDETYNYEQMLGLGINDTDAKAAAEYFAHIYFGKVRSNNCLEVANNVYIELANQDGNILVLWLSDDRIREILDADLNTMTAIAEVGEEEEPTEKVKEEPKEEQQAAPKKQQTAPANTDNTGNAGDANTAGGSDQNAGGANNGGNDEFIPNNAGLPDNGYDSGTFRP